MTEQVKTNLKLQPQFYEGYIDQTKSDAPKREVTVDFVFEKAEIDPEKGVLLHFVGCKYPRKCLPVEADLRALDIVKRYFMAYIMGIAGKEMILPAVAFAILPWSMKIKAINRSLERMAIFGMQTLNFHVLKYEYRCPPAKEIQWFVYEFLKKLGIRDDICQDMGRIFSMFIQNDDAYRFRVQDVFSEFTKEDFINKPMRSIKKVVEIIESRDELNVSRKFKAFASILRFSLLHPKIRKAFKRAIRFTDFPLLQFDEADKYHILLRPGYKYMGRTIEDRVDEWLDIHGGEDKIPPVTEQLQ